jgi:hypothetical protein
MTEISRKGKGINLPDINIDNFKYWDDPRWAEVKRLRSTGDPADHRKADDLETKIKKHWGAS